MFNGFGKLFSFSNFASLYNKIDKLIHMFMKTPCMNKFIYQFLSGIARYDWN